MIRHHRDYPEPRGTVRTPTDTVAVRLAPLQGPRVQGGVALVTSLVILLVMSILGVTALRSITLEGKMAANAENRNMAVQAAESALRSGEQWLLGQPSEPNPLADGSSGVWDFAGPDPDVAHTDPWWEEGDACWWSQCDAAACGAPDTVPYDGNPAARTCAATDLDARLAHQPRYLIEYQGYAPDSLVIGNTTGPPTGRVVYRATSRGTGGTETTNSLLQTTVLIRFD